MKGSSEMLVSDYFKFAKYKIWAFAAFGGHCNVIKMMRNTYKNLAKKT